MNLISETTPKKRLYKGIDFPHEGGKIIGVAGQPFVDMEPFLDSSNFAQLHGEACYGLAKNFRSFAPGKFVGDLPPEIRSTEYPDNTLEAQILSQIDALPDGATHRERLESLDTQQSRVYCYLALKTLSPWHSVLYLRKNTFTGKTDDNGAVPSWEPAAKDFPLLREFIEQMEGNIFKNIGRIVFFITQNGMPVPPHRDYKPVPHRDHCVNFFFDGGRKTYLYDCETREKIFLDRSCRAYFFNNRDYHGVDSENSFRYTLRVDGTFTPQILEKIGIPDGWVISPGDGSNA